MARSGLRTRTTYYYAVVAEDSSGSEMGRSAVLPVTTSGLPWWVWPVLLAAVVAILTAWPRPKALVKVDKIRFPLQDIKDGEEVCCLAGPGASDCDLSKAVIVSATPKAPPAKLASVCKGPGRTCVTVKGVAPRFTACCVDDNGTEGPYVRLDEKQTLRVKGTWRPTSYGREESVEIEVEIAVELINKAAGNA